MTTLQILTLKTMTYKEAESAKAVAVVDRVASLACAALVLARRVGSASRARTFGKSWLGSESMMLRA